MKIFHRRPMDQRGVTSVEYALVIGLVSLLMVAAAVDLGGGFTVWATTLVNTVGSLLS
ncbi:MAG: Flp family type IVb pilin [Aeromicrobium sp.]|nr:Flp family type IVb pilin [Aeromicrobium sp.]